MTTTTKLSNGLAFRQDKTLRMFADMAAKGKQLSGLGALGHGWTFVDAPPEQAIFDIAYEDAPDPGYFDIFAAAGWAHVLSIGDIHIFKAKPGTPPVHTAVESRREELTTQRDRYAKASIIAVLTFVATLIALRFVPLPRAVETTILALLLFPVAYTVLPLLGFTHRLRKLG